MIRLVLMSSDLCFFIDSAYFIHFSDSQVNCTRCVYGNKTFGETVGETARTPEGAGR
jgi:hypothetical protein